MIRPRARPLPRYSMSILRTSRGFLAAYLAVAATLLAIAPGRSSAQARSSGPGPASYTTQQAEAGQMVFDEICARCHSGDLTGGEGPPLVGPPLLYNWGGQNIAGLIRFVRINMPMSAPGTLDDEQAVNVIAYVLSRNRVAAGSAPLTATSTGVLIVPPPGQKR